MARSALPAAGVVALSVVLAGCGGNDDRPSAVAVGDCESLVNLRLDPATTIVSASSVAAGPVTGRLASQVYATTPYPVAASCRVKGVSKPTNDSDINFQVWLPKDGWNGKFLSVAEGGLSGFVNEIGFSPAASQSMADALRRGYATASTDTGHPSQDDTAWIVGHPEKVVDYAYRAKHLTTVAAKSIVAAFYGASAKYSYFAGCSNGGRQGLVEAERYPDDFDGMVIGAPSNFQTRDTISYVQDFQLSRDPRNIPSSTQIASIQKAVLAKCDTNDGVLDGVIDDPRQCAFDPGTLACTGAPDGTCLEPATVAAMRKYFGGVTNSRGERIANGRVPGAEISYAIGVLRTPQLVGQMYHQVENWEPFTYNVDTDPQLVGAKLGPLLDATTGKLQPRQKIIQYHGWSDPSVPPQDSIDYYNAVSSQAGGPAQADRFYRLFMVPGMSHCSSGPGPNAFGNGDPVLGPQDRQNDVLIALEAWVEQGLAPDRIIATRYRDDDASKGVARTRPLCPYPRYAKYNGSGSVDVAGNYSCVAP